MALPELPQLPALPPAPADVEVRRASLQRAFGRRPPADGVAEVAAHEALVRWTGVGAFRVRNGREVTVEPAPGAEAPLVRLYLEGPVLGLLLWQRGCLLLHASAVEVGGRVAVFLGASGAGKSTLATALVRAGHRLVADDIVVVRPGAGTVTVAPGIPRLKLWPDALHALGPRPARARRLHSRTEKRALTVRSAFESEPRPLERLYVLERSRHAAPQQRPLTPARAVPELIRHTYGARLIPRLGAAEHFRRCAELARAVPLTKLALGRNLGALPRLAAQISHDLAG